MSEADTQQGDGEVGVCHVCGERFETQEALASHLMRAHADDVSSSHSDPTQPGEATGR
jgi:hypothetical protein